MFRNGPKPVVMALSVALSSAPAMFIAVGLVRLPPKRLRRPPPEAEEKVEDEEKVPVTVPAKSFSVVLELELLVLVSRPVSGLLLSWMRGVLPGPIKSAPPESPIKPAPKEPPVPVVMGLSMALRS